ncbi:WD repeat-containing protein jip5 [Cryptotrichosporon argae]
MAEIKLRNQPFDLAFHPTASVLYTSLLTGEVKAFRYDDATGSTSAGWSVRPSRRTARALAVEEGGEHIWVGGKSGALFRLGTEGGELKTEIDEAHEAPINRVFCVNENLVVSGDDDGVIKFWDPRQTAAIRSYAQHFDYISDLHYFDDKRQLVTTSGDAHLSVIDIRSSKPSPLHVSEDQEDELLSLAPIKGGQKLLVGTGTGVLTVWDRKRGWGDCVDRIPGHPASVDAIVALTPDIVATGSEDGMVRVMQILPNKFLGVIATHDEYPIERMRLDRRGKWLASVSHDERIKLTDVEDMFEDSDGEDDGEGEADSDNDMGGSEGGGEDEADEDSDEDMGGAMEGVQENKKGGGFFGDL